MNYRAALIRAVTFLGGIYFFLQFILPPAFIKRHLGIAVEEYNQDITNGFIVVGAMAIGLGIINILMVHGSRIIFRRPRWLNSVALLAGLSGMLFVTYVDWSQSRTVAADAERVFMLRDFADRIVADLGSGNGAHLPAPTVRNRLLASAALKEIERIARDEQRLPRTAEPLDVELSEALLSELQSTMASAQSAIATLSVDPAEPGGIAVDRNRTVARLLGEIGSLRLQYLGLVNKYTLGQRLYVLLYSGLFVSLGAAMFSLLGFYIASAAYRAFRVRSGESALMLGAAVLVMLGQIPFGIALWDAFPEVRLWLLSVPSAAAFRAIKIGAGVAGLIMAYRMWFSIESEEFVRSR